MTAEAFVGSFVERQLAAVTTYTGIEHRIGAAEDARTGAPPRIVWVPPEKGAIKISPAPFARAGGDVRAWAEASFEVHFWAESYDAAQALYSDTWCALDDIFGPPMGRPSIDGDPMRPGYDLSDPAQVAAPELVAGSVLLVATATLREFVERKNGLALGPPIVSVPHVTALGATADDSTPEDATSQEAAA